MTLALFKLESFTPQHPGGIAEAIYAKSDLDEAYANGLADGLSRKEDDEMRNLAAGLKRLEHALAEDGARRIELRNEAVATLLPLLEAIVDGMAPAHDGRRLETALRDELARLAHLATPLRARIACGAQLRGVVERCLSEGGIDGIELIETDGACISLSLQGGRIEISPEKIARDIRALLAELIEDENTWTQ